MVLEADQRHDFVDQVVLVLHVAGDAPARGHLAVVPALHVDRVDAVELQVAAIDAAGEGADHAAVFKLVEAPAGGGKDEDRQAGVAEDEQFHVAAEARGIPLMVFTVHGYLKVGLPANSLPTCSVPFHLLEKRGFLDTVTATGCCVFRAIGACPRSGAG